MDALTPAKVDNLRDWNPGSRTAPELVSSVRALISPEGVISAAACLSEGTLTANARRLIIEILEGLATAKNSATADLITWLKNIDSVRQFGLAIKAAVQEPTISAAVLCHVYPHICRSDIALNGALSFLVLGRRHLEEGNKEIVARVTTILSELANITESHGNRRSFRDLLEGLQKEGRINEIFLKGVGLEAKHLSNRMQYEPVFRKMSSCLPDNYPDGLTWRYVKRTAQRLNDYVQSISGQLKQQEKRRGRN